MPYTFFSFPSEIRSMIYKLLLISENDERNITPDPQGTRKKYGMLSRAPQLPGAAALLRTCQHIYAEATDILYGENVFYFDDRQHGEETFTQPGFFAPVRRSDMTAMYTFFQGIRRAQRLKVRHIHLHFTGETYTVFSYEIGKASGANHFCEALDLFRDGGHRITSIELTFSDQILTRRPSSSSLSSPYRRLFRKLEAIRGVKELRSRTVDALPNCAPSDDEEGLTDEEFLDWYHRKLHAKFRAEFMAFKARMEQK